MDNKPRRYLNLNERLQLIKDIQLGKYAVKQKRGLIKKRINKKLYAEHCKIIDVLETIAEIKLIGKGSYGKAFRVCMPKYEECDLYNEDTIAYAVKEIKFQDAGTYNTLINNPDRYENTEIRMLQFLSKFVLSNATPHINLPIMSFICEPTLQLSDRHEHDLSTKRIIVSELADYGNLYTFMNNRLKRWNYNINGWKVLFFQILNVLAVIHRYYPNFLHNDLKLDNMLVRSTPGDVNTFFEYTVNDVKYYVPDIGFQILLWDFDFSCIAGTIDNDKILAMIDVDDANLVVHRNQYYDIHMCFGLMNRYWGSNMPDEISDWIEEFVLNEQIPSASRDERILEGKEYTTPAKLLRTKFFDQFKTRIPDDATIIAKFSGELDEDVDFDFGDEKNRYTDPTNCQFQNYVFLDPKKSTKQEKEEYHNRYLCTLASQHQNYLPYLSKQQNDDIEKWIIERMNDYSIRSALKENEIKIIVYTTIDLFSQFLQRYNVTTDLIYAIAISCLMYASYQHLFSYVVPFNDFSYWYNITNLNPGELEDVYKQFTGFIAKHIETV